MAQIFRLKLYKSQEKNLEMLRGILRLMREGHKGPHRMSKWYSYEIHGVWFREQVCLIPCCRELRRKQVAKGVGR
jgi:hypothetical protein